jgi:transcriptional regulator with XRE-family HTH domain
MKIGTTISILRREKGYSQTRFADMIGISQTALSHIEKSYSIPHPENFKKICEALGVPGGYIYLLSIDENDIPARQLPLFREFQPIIEKMISKILEQ